MIRKFILAAGALVLSAAAQAAPILADDFSGSENVVDFTGMSGSASGTSFSVGSDVSLSTGDGSPTFWLIGNFGNSTAPGLGVYQSATDVIVDFTETWQRVGLEIGVGNPGTTFQLSFFDAALSLLGAVDVVQGSNFYGLGFGGFESSGGIKRVRVVETTGGNGFAGVFDNIRFENGATVPEPGMVGLFGLGVLGLASARRRRAA